MEVRVILFYRGKSVGDIILNVRIKYKYSGGGV